MYSTILACEINVAIQYTQGGDMIQQFGKSGEDEQGQTFLSHLGFKNQSLEL